MTALSDQMHVNQVLLCARPMLLCVIGSRLIRDRGDAAGAGALPAALDELLHELCERGARRAHQQRRGRGQGPCQHSCLSCAVSACLSLSLISPCASLATAPLCSLTFHCLCAERHPRGPAGAVQHADAGRVAAARHHGPHHQRRSRQYVSGCFSCFCLDCRSDGSCCARCPVVSAQLRAWRSSKRCWKG